MSKLNETINGKNSSLKIDAFETYQTEGIFHLGRPTPYRADCQYGTFKIKDKPIPGDLTMDIIAVKKVVGEFFDYEYQDWLEVVFIDSGNTVSNILFKTESLDNFLDTVKMIYKAGKSIASTRWTGSMSPRMSKRLGKKYYAVEFTTQPQDQARLEELTQFVNDNSEILNYSSMPVLSSGSSQELDPSTLIADESTKPVDLRDQSKNIAEKLAQNVKPVQTKGGSL